MKAAADQPAGHAVPEFVVPEIMRIIIPAGIGHLLRERGHSTPAPATR
jgi:hypothetical protein